MKVFKLKIIGVVVTALYCSSGYAEGFFDFKPGDANAPITGSASAEGAQNAAPSLEKCEKQFGTIAVVQPQDQVMASLQRYNLPPPNSLLRLMIQQSNCFQVVERGIGMQNLMQERALSYGGELQSGSNIGQGQMVTADFLLTPEVTFNEKNAGGAGLGAVGGFFGIFGLVAGAIASGFNLKQAQTTLLLTDARSGIQVTAAEGSVEKADWGIGGFLGGVGAGAYTNTAEGKVVAAALLDNYNNIVKSIKSQPSLIASKADPSSSKNAANSVRANAFNSGDVIRGKIAGIKILASPNAQSDTVHSLKKEDEVIFLGEENGDFLKVQDANGEGWVDKKFMTR